MQFMIIKTDQFKNIPKIMHFYWGFNIRMSYLNFLSLYSFQRFNPDWQIVIHKPVVPSNHVLSPSVNDNKFNYIAKDYSFYLDRIKNLEINEFNFEKLNIKSETAEVFKSDFLRWHLLATIGGGWSDMDILYVKPLSNIKVENRMMIGNIKAIDTVIVFKDYGYHPIGFYLSSGSNPFFQLISENAIKNFDSKEYQSVGRLLLDKLYPDYNTISHHHSNLNILDMTSSTIYPFSPRLINLIFNMNAKQFVRKETIGIHWYNGSKISKDFNNTYHLHKGKNLSGFSRIISCGKRTCTIQEYLKDYDDFYTKLNNNM